mmetsp:Transcript_21382/g.43164  ORF Transcript_21382/g.43164 Transcript_21382/m.43164 type:complete len:227 (-) Transcript_21382:332-1012(-)
MSLENSHHTCNPVDATACSPGQHEDEILPSEKSAEHDAMVTEISSVMAASTKSQIDSLAHGQSLSIFSGVTTRKLVGRAVGSFPIKTVKSKMTPSEVTVKKKKESTPSAFSLKRQQRQLLLLHHASRCPHPIGQCPVTTHCAQAMRLHEHIVNCPDGYQCTTPHCASSKYLLSHYAQCGGGYKSLDLSSLVCPVCRPIRAAILKSRRRTDGALAREVDAKLNLMNL